jgi:flagellar biosynthetic protein FliQ
MSQAMLQTIASQAIMVTLKLALPTLMVSLGVGLLVSVIQAVTQIQEQTLSFIPKAFAVGMVLVLMGPWMLNSLIAFTQEMYLQIPQMTSG